ncbi:MAG: putative zinc-binding metallopeptidase [Phycisphaerales bacterium]
MSQVKRRQLRPRDLEQLEYEELLDTQLRDLPIAIEGTDIETNLQHLYGELEQRRIRHRPHVWISSEWFSPDGVPGFAVPFYLLHPRLQRLEKKMMLEAEGAGPRECMRIMRHECGHAICSAYRLHYKPRWRKAFGKYSQTYPTHYQPDPFSRKYVLHFQSWYAQAHPAEDFAETFAVWLRPRSQWRRQYAGWPALAKLETVDQLFTELAEKPAAVRNRRFVDPLSDLSMTLRQHYRRKQRRYAEEWPEVYDRDLRRIFSDEERYRNRESAAGFLRRIRPRVRRVAADWTGHNQYNIDQVLKDMIDRCRDLKLRLACSRQAAEQGTLLLVTIQTMNYLHRGGHQYAI